MEFRRLRYLDRDLQAGSVRWQAGTEEDAVRTPEAVRPWGITSIHEIAVLDDRVFLEGRKYDRAVIVELAFDGGSRHATGREVAEWAAVPGEEIYWQMMPAQTLAVTSGKAAAAFALRFGPAVHVQQLSGRSRKLEAFPDLEAPLPVFRPILWQDQQEYQEYYATLEAASYPASLYGEGESLFVLMKGMEGDEPVWDLHRVDPLADTIVSRTRLPSKATFVSLLPGPKYWVLEESTSGLVDFFRKPTRLLLLDSAAVRSGEPISCE